MNNKLIKTMGVILVVGLLLTACNLPGSSSPTSTEAANNAYSGGSTAAPTAAPTEAPAAAGNCLVGTWSLTDFASYMDSIKQNLSASSNNDVTFTSGDFSGSATFVFNADNTTSLNLDNFSQSFTMTMKVSDTAVEIPITLNMNGNSSSDYSVDGDQITFSNQNPGDSQINIEIEGSVSAIDQSMFGEPGTQKLYQYSCVDANTLSLKVIAVESMDLAPLILTRVP